MSQGVQHRVKLIIVGVIVLFGLGGGVTAYIATHNSNDVHTVTNGQNQLTQISYRGQNGVDALSMLKERASVGVKHYSFGDLVTSINGSQGTGPKYWTFYINGKEATVGASDYKTKDSDTLTWKLR